MNRNLKGGLNFNGGKPQPLEVRKSVETAPLEKQIQGAFLDWVRLFERQYPILKCIYPVPNGLWAMNKKVAMNQRIRKGIPDVNCDAPSHDGRYIGLKIEFKRDTKSSKQSEEQVFYHKFFADLGYRTVVCRSAHEAAIIVNEHLGIKVPIYPK